VDLEVSVSGDEFYHAQLLLTRLRRRTSVGLAILFLSLLALAIVLFAGGNALGVLLLTPAIVFLIGRTMVRYVFLPETSLRSYSQQKVLHSPQLVRITPDGIAATSRYGQGQLPWDHFIKWREDDRMFLLHQTDNQVLILPKRVFAGEQQRQELVALLISKRIPAA